VHQQKIAPAFSALPPSMAVACAPTVTQRHSELFANDKVHPAQNDLQSAIFDRDFRSATPQRDSVGGHGPV
jgi:hypothetical protein